MIEIIDYTEAAKEHCALVYVYGVLSDEGFDKLEEAIENLNGGVKLTPVTGDVQIVWWDTRDHKRADIEKLINQAVGE
jgi:hypothetical protein